LLDDRQQPAGSADLLHERVQSLPAQPERRLALDNEAGQPFPCVGQPGSVRIAASARGLVLFFSFA